MFSVFLSVHFFFFFFLFLFFFSFSLAFKFVAAMLREEPGLVGRAPGPSLEPT